MDLRRPLSLPLSYPGRALLAVRLPDAKTTDLPLVQGPPDLRPVRVRTATQGFLK